MSAHCSKCGSDITYPGDTWPVGTCERCDLEARVNRLESALILAIETAEVLNEALRRAVSENLLSMQAAVRIGAARNTLVNDKEVKHLNYDS